MKIRLVIAALVSVVSATAAMAQVEMADQFRQDGKIYVVVAVILAIFIGLIAVMIRMERKLADLEKKQQNQTSHQN